MNTPTIDDLQKRIDEIEQENRKMREDLREKRKLRELQSKIEDLEQEQEDIQYEMQTGICREEEKRKIKQIERIIPSYPIRKNDIWL